MNARWNDVVDLVAGGTDPRVRRAMAAELLADPTFAREVAALETLLAPMAARGGEAPPPAGLWDRIDAALEDEARVGGYSANLRLDEGTWESIGPGAWRKLLWDERTVLARLEPGAVYASHEHDVVEHCVVLSGTMLVEGVAYHPGDYHAPFAGTRHGAIGTPDGLLLLIRYGD